MADLNPGTYRYLYSYVLPGQPYGAFHGSETYLLFKVPIPPNPVTDSVSDNLIDLWTRFAKTGDPNGGMNVTWPQYTREGDRYLDIGDIPTVKSGYPSALFFAPKKNNRTGKIPGFPGEE
jgi:para-nitrobenzyl esterase